MGITMISHSGLVVPYGILEHGQILWFVQPQAITWANTDLLNWNSKDEFKWNFNQNTVIFFEENAYDSVCQMVAALLRPQFINSLVPGRFEQNFR